MNESGKKYLIILLLFSVVSVAAGRGVYAAEAEVTFGVG